LFIESFAAVSSPLAVVMDSPSEPAPLSTLDVTVILCPKEVKISESKLVENALLIIHTCLYVKVKGANVLRYKGEFKILCLKNIAM
jgi:hypothetical protein